MGKEITEKQEVEKDLIPESKAVGTYLCKLAVRQPIAKFKVTLPYSYGFIIKYKCTRNSIPQQRILLNKTVASGTSFIDIDLNDFGLGNIQNGDEVVIMTTTSSVIKTVSAPITEF